MSLNYLFHYTFPQLLTAPETINDEQGKIWAGDVRKYDMLQPGYHISLWKAWQQSFKTQKEVPPEAMNYFQETKHLSRPPKEGDRNIMQNAPIEPTLIQKPKFSWSHSAVSDFDTCPYQYAHKRIYKTIPYEETEATIWGTRVHKAAEDAVNGLPVTDEEAFSPVAPYARLFQKKKEAGATVLTEYQMGLTEDWKATGFKEGCGRIISDVLIVEEDKCFVADYKGLDVDTKLATPSGWTTMGDISVGDQLFGSDGVVCSVVGKSKVKHLACFRVVFDNNTSIVCDEEHLWGADVAKPRQSSYTRSVLNVVAVKDLLARGMRVKVPVAGKLDLPDLELPTHPYVLGVWLGDGKHSSGEVSEPDIELFEKVKEFGYDYGADISGKGNSCCTRTIYGLMTQLKALGVFKNKHVPQQYLRASYRQRLDLLRGIMDTDGHWNPRRKSCVFTSVDEAFAKQVYELICTLGVRASFFKVKKKGFGKELWGYDVVFSGAEFNPFYLPRKAKAYELSQSARTKWLPRTHRRVLSVEPVDSVPTQCISVDSPDNMYLCGESMIPTHNTGKRRDKNGKPKTISNDQLIINAIAAAIHFPQLKEFNAKYLYVSEPDPAFRTPGFDKPLTRAELLPHLQHLQSKLNRMKEAISYDNYKYQPSGLCRAYCGAFDCPHNGRKG